ncbi:MAG: hypothetical protein BWK76_11545 [Desulfobulbaceae bacterium A2]|nr:MAG: hypothetical protein BWK76_11545 [Desulfobulbaceae bacterium A2]
MKTAGYFITTLLFLATIPAHAQESERVRQIEQELHQLRGAMVEQEQRVKALEQQMQGVDPDKVRPAPGSAQPQESPSQGD